jgi:hypothetical protein
MLVQPHTSMSARQHKPLEADSPFYHWWITAVLMLGLTTAGLSVTVVQLAFPHMMTSLRANLDLAQIKAMTMLQQLTSAEAALHSYHDTFIIHWPNFCCWDPALSVAGQSHI